MLAVTSHNVLLLDSGTPQSATLVVDTSSGNITSIAVTRVHNPRNVKPFRDYTDDQWIALGDKHVLPGLVECALRH